MIVMMYHGFPTWEWIALTIAMGVIAVAYSVWSHDREIRRRVRCLDDVPVDLPRTEGSQLTGTLEPTDTTAPTAIVCVTSFSGFGLHLVAAVHRLFPRQFSNLIFVSAGPLESRHFKPSRDLGRLRGDPERELKKYVAWARGHGLRAGYRTKSGFEVISTQHEICRELVQEYPHGVVLIGKPIFQEKEYPLSIHSRMVTTFEQRLLFDDIPAIVLPVTVPDA